MSDDITDISAKELLDKVGKRFVRFLGADISYREHSTDWPKKWRVKTYAASNTRYDYRETIFCDTWEEALTALANAGKRQDKENNDYFSRGQLRGGDDTR